MKTLLWIVLGAAGPLFALVCIVQHAGGIMSAYQDSTLKELMLIGDEDFKRLDSKDRLVIIQRLNCLHADKSGTKQECREYRAPIDKRMSELRDLHEQAWADLWRNY